MCEPTAKAINVLYLIHYPVFGGPHNRALRLAPVLEAHGVATTVLLPAEPGSAIERLRAAGIDVAPMALHRLRATANPRAQFEFARRILPEVRAIRRLIRERAIDIVQVGGLVNPHGAIAAWLEGLPIVWQVLDTRPPMALRRVMMPIVSRLADSVMFSGAGLIAAHPGAEALQDRSFVFYPPVDMDLFSPGPADGQSVRNELGIPPTAPVVGMVANINPQKGHEYFVRAAARIKQQQPEARFIVAGASYETHRAYETRVRTLARELGVADAVLFVGERNDAQRIFRAMDVALITSVPNSEGAPTSAQEAMAVGTPVVGTDVGAVADVIDDGVTGYVVPPSDPEAIADAALRLLEDAPLRERMGRASRVRAMERFSLERCAQTHLEAYDHALRRAGRPGITRAEDVAAVGAGRQAP